MRLGSKYYVLTKQSPFQQWLSSVNFHGFTYVDETLTQKQFYVDRKLKVCTFPKTVKAKVMTKKPYVGLFKVDVKIFSSLINMWFVHVQIRVRTYVVQFFGVCTYVTPMWCCAAVPTGVSSTYDEEQLCEYFCQTSRKLRALGPLRSSCNIPLWFYVLKM